MGTCGQPGFGFRDFPLKQGIDFIIIDFIIFCLNQGIDFIIFCLNHGIDFIIFCLNQGIDFINFCLKQGIF